MNKEGEGYGNNFKYNLSTTQLFLYLYIPLPPTQKISLINGLKAYMHEGLFLANKILLLDSLLQEGRLKQLIDACKPLNLWTALSKVLHM